MLSREEILARKVTGLPTETYTIDGVGDVVIRGLTRNEGLAVQKCEDTEDRDNLVISAGLVEPRMSVDDVAEWAANEQAGCMTKLSNRIAELSGMVEGAGKSGVSRARRKS
jgi:hypothetical protein